MIYFRAEWKRGALFKFKIQNKLKIHISKTKYIHFHNKNATVDLLFIDNTTKYF